MLVMLTLFGLSYRFYGSEATWHFWNIPTLNPSFIDLRILTGSADSFRAGLNPIYSNPGDPLGRRFNLPFAWYYVFYTGIQRDDAVWLGILLALGYLFSAWIFPRQIGFSAALMLAILLFSPASMLAIERGNVDLFIFILCTLMLLLLENHSLPATALLMVASFLKFFPIFGLAVVLRETRYRFWITSLAVFTVLLVYAVLTYPNTSASFANTEKGAVLSYGVDVIPLYLGQLSGSQRLFDLLTLVFSFVGLGLFLFAFYLGSKLDALPSRDMRHLSAFRLGAAIYLGTFLVGDNWDYRLVFLLFTVPQLVEWAKASSAEKAAQWTIVSLMIACWYLISFSVFNLIPGGTHVAYLLDQVSKWALFFGLGYLFSASAPDWLKAEIRKKNMLRKPRSA